MLHPVRRSRFERALQAHQDPTILFVCLGNICRSPYAEHRLRADLAAVGATHLEIESAGFVQPDRPSPPEAQRVAARRGLDLSEHRSRTLDEEIMRRADLIFVMSTGQRRDLEQAFGRSDGVLVLGDGDPETIESRTIMDPVERPESVFETVYDRVDRCCALVTATLSPSATRARDAPDRDAGEPRRPLRMGVGF